MSEREKDYSPLSMACVRGLCDKLYDKRKIAGTEIEKMVKDFNDANNTSQLKKLIRVLGQDLMSSTNPNVKNGALMGLSAFAVGLGKDCVKYLPELLAPILACVSEQARVRYQAVEALYNVVKMAREASLDHLPPLFDALTRLATDHEPQVAQANEQLDRLLKDIVTESAEFDVAAFIPLIRERIYARGAPARQLVISWLSVLDAVPQVDLVPLLPPLLDGLFRMLDDPSPEIRRMCEVQLSEFLRSMKKDPSRADFPAMINVLIAHATCAQELLQLTAVSWMKSFVEVSGRDMLPFASGMLLAVLPCLAYSDEPRRNIRETASIVNMQLLKLVAPEEPTESKDSTDPKSQVDPKDQTEHKEPVDPKDSGDPTGEKDQEPKLDVPACVTVLVQMLHHSSVHTKVAALDWILHLYAHMSSEMCGVTETVFSAALSGVSDTSDAVVRRALAVLADICHLPPHADLESSPYYHKFLKALIKMLAADEALLEDRGAFIIRQLCVLLNAEQLYLSLSQLIPASVGPAACCALVQQLSSILLTAAELQRTRRQLADRAPRSESWRRLFRSLYRCWCHSPVCLLALCLLTHNYTHCELLIHTFGELEITVDFLTEVDKLVQLIESPIFAYLRLELLSGAESVPLRNALYGVLMLLPQSEAFHTLRRRLQCVPTHAPTSSPHKPSQWEDSGIDFDECLEEFKRVQKLHRDNLDSERERRRSFYS